MGEGLYAVILDYDQRYRVSSWHPNWAEPEGPAVIVWRSVASSREEAWAAAQKVVPELAELPLPDAGSCDVLTKVEAIRAWKAQQKVAQRRKVKPGQRKKEKPEPPSTIHWTERNTIRARVYRAVRDAGAKGITHEALKRKLNFAHRSTVVADLKSSGFFRVKEKIEGKGKDKEVNVYVLNEEHPDHAMSLPSNGGVVVRPPLATPERIIAEAPEVEETGAGGLYQTIMDILRAAAPQKLSTRDIADRLLAMRPEAAAAFAEIGLTRQPVANMIATYIFELCRWREHVKAEVIFTSGRKRKLYSIGDDSRTNRPYYRRG